MKKTAIFSIIICLLAVSSVEARKFSFNLKNKTSQQIQIFYQVFDQVERENPIFLFDIEVGKTKIAEIKIKKSQKIKFFGYGGGVETLPIVRDFQTLTDKDINQVELVLPKVEKINVIELNDLLDKVKNENVLNILLDTAKFVKDEMPPLGTFIFYNVKSNNTLIELPTFWANTSTELRQFNNEYYDIIDFVNSSNAASLKLSNVPFLKKLGASFENTNLLELQWDIDNAHIEQWQPKEKTIFEIINDARLKRFVDACVNEMSVNNLAGGDYRLYFISSAVVVDRIVISAKKYNKVEINAEATFEIPNDKVEVVKTPEIGVKYGYLKEKLYSNVDSAANLYLKVLALDYTPALNAYITEQAIISQKSIAITNANEKKNAIIVQYAAIRQIDNSLPDNSNIEVIMPIVSITTDRKLKQPTIDSTGIDITPQYDKDYNSTVPQFNKLLDEIKNNIFVYGETLKRIEELSQPMDYYNVVVNIREPIVLSKEVLTSIKPKKE
ncbi:MAG: hypothetical protein H6565_10290 [Lewinellaceae bacterium]|nr:hypothetical protein [Lewinellaceae bacterium]